jgi:hypothetical protein
MKVRTLIAGAALMLMCGGLGVCVAQEAPKPAAPAAAAPEPAPSAPEPAASAPEPAAKPKHHRRHHRHHHGKMHAQQEFSEQELQAQAPSK